MMARRGRGRRGWGHGRRAAGMLNSALLLLLHKEPSHGYTLREQIAHFGLETIDPSAIYRALRDMEEEGLVVSTWDEEQSQGPPRRIYRLTTAGDAVLAEWIAALDETRAMIESLIAAYDSHMTHGTGAHHGAPGE